MGRVSKVFVVLAENISGWWQLGEGEWRHWVSDFTKLVRGPTSKQSCSISAVICGGVVATAETEGVATPTILSAFWVSSSTEVSGLAEANTILTLEGSLWRNNLWTNAPFESPGAVPLNSCCIRQSNCVGFQSPSSLVFNNCCNLSWSAAAVCFTDCSLSIP